MCLVAAPSKLQRPSGDRVKTDARDAAHLARLLHLGQIVEVSVPSVEQEAARDLVRAREDCRGDLMTVRHRVSKLLLRQGIVYSGGQAWTGKHEMWLRGQRFDAPTVAAGLSTARSTRCWHGVHRRDRLDEAIDRDGRRQRVHPGGARGWAACAGSRTLTAFGLAVEIGDWHRLTGRSIGAYLGSGAHRVLLGASRVQGGITKTGNGHARRLLVEAAWHHRRPYRPGARSAATLECGQPAAARDRGHRANRRLHDRWVHFDERKKRPVVANAAIARELAGWCWSLAVLDG